MNKQYHLLYKITNMVNGKIYIGIHSTDCIFDGYRGSGKLLLKAYAKYDAMSFMYEIISNFDTRGELLAAEKSVVDIEFVKRPDTYNLKIGGEGGQLIGVPRPQLVKDKISRAQKGKAKHPGFSINCSIGQKGRTHSDHTKRLMSTARRGPVNGLYGKPSHKRGPHWVYFDDLKILWLEHNQPKAHKFKTLVITKGYPDVNYAKMIMVFNNELKHLR